MKLLLQTLKYILIIIGILSVSSCISETEIGQPDPLPAYGNTAEISFIAQMPTATAVKTRGVGTGSENEIKNGDIYVLVFETTGELIYKGKPKSAPVATGQNGNIITFKVTLPVGKTYDFMLLANAGQLLSDINAGDGNTKDDVQAQLVQKINGEPKKWSLSQAIPMWSEKNNTRLNTSSTLVFTLTRMLARINVEYNPAAASSSYFKLTSIRFYNYNTEGALIPAANNYNVSENGNIIVTKPTIPASSELRVEEDPLVYENDITDKDGGYGQECKNKIYVFEAEHKNTYTGTTGNDEWIKNPCLVIGGRYDASGNGIYDGIETYYRVDFVKKTTVNGVTTDEWLSILRNFSYNVVITSVNGEGFSEPEIALKSAPFMIEANVLDWEERDMGNIAYDGIFYLSISQDEFVFQRNEANTELQDESNVVYIKTDYVYGNNVSHANSGWQVEKQEDLQGNPVTWLSLNPATKPGGWQPNDKNKAHFTFETNTGDSNREANVWIRAGSLRYKIHVVQRILSLDIIDPDNNNAPIGEMLFVIPRSGSRAHPPRRFTVNWTPAGKDVAITSESPTIWNPFIPEWITPNPEPAWKINGGSGTQPYTVQADEVDDAQLLLDPFYEKETTYYFEVNNGDDSEKKGIRLHQIYYNIIVDTYVYRLDGKTYTLSVRSNTDWVITNIEEWLYNRDPATDPPPSGKPVLLRLNHYDNLRVGTSGGYNTSGESVAFTVVDQNSLEHSNKWGTVYVTFESPDGKFPPQRVALNFSPHSKILLGLGAARDVRAYNVAFPSTYHVQGANRLLTAQANFGMTDESTVKIDGFRIVGYNCTGSSTTGTGDENWHTGYLKNWLNEHNPDVITINYSMILNASECALIKQYLDRGGAAIVMYSATTSTQVGTFMNAIFNTTFTTSGSNPDVIRLDDAPPTGAVYKMAEGDAYAGDPILNGPFGDIRGKNWGAHYYRAGIKASLIQDQAYILSLSDDELSRKAGPTNLGYATMFRHKTLNLLFIGNGYFTASYYPRYELTETYHDPFRTTNEFKPAVRNNFGPYDAVYFNQGFDVYNSFVFANAVAWALSESNHTPPANGY